MRQLTETELHDMAEALSELTLVEAFKLMSILDKEFGIRIADDIVEKDVICSPGDGDWCADDIEEKEHRVFLIHAGPYKLAVVKAIKEITGLGLRTAKDIADRTDVGKSLVQTVDSINEAEYIKNKLELQGATVIIE